MIPPVSGSATTTLLAILSLTLLAAGCRKVIKTRVRVDPAPTHRQALQSTLPELVQLVNTRYAGPESLVAKMSLELEGESAEAIYRERYRKAPAQFISKRPDSIRINVLNPLTQTTVVALASHQNTFQIWAPRENKFFTGSTDLDRNHDNPLYNVRPEHVLPALLIEPLPVGPEARVFMVEEEDARSRYYLIHELHPQKLLLKRRLRIERSRLELVRQVYYDDSGGVASSIRYTLPVSLGDVTVNTGVVLERPRDRYTLRLRLDPERLKVDREFEARHFRLAVPPGAELITLR